MSDLFACQADDVSLLVSELVTDSVRQVPDGHGAEIQLVVKVSTDRVRVEVRDALPIAERVRSLSMSSVNGFKLVDSVADRWGVVHANKACAWFEIDRSSKTGD